jgi:hypothetical protein
VVVGMAVLPHLQWIAGRVRRRLAELDDLGDRNT